jgi:hypothetical protein
LRAELIWQVFESRVPDICECKGDEGIGSRENDLVRNLAVYGRFIKLKIFWGYGCRADAGKHMYKCVWWNVFGSEFIED